MQFISKKPKINISSRHFYFLMVAVVIMIMTNTVFFGMSMDTKQLIDEVAKTSKPYNTVKWLLISNYLAFSAVLVVFSIHTFLARFRLKVGYVYTNTWNVLVTAIIAIPIVINPDFSDYRIWINLILYFIFLSAMFFVYKEIFELRRAQGYWTENNGGMSW